MKNKIVFAVSGDQGSFSEKAAHVYAQKNNLAVELRYLLDMENVLAAVETQDAELGIFPIVNLRGGLVKMAFTAMGKHQFTPIDELWLEINQCLLAQSDCEASQIKKIVSHAQALAQCKNYLQQHFPDAELIEWQDTAKAARDLADHKIDKSCAVIAPETSATLYGLKVLAAHIEDEQPNLTAFVIVRK
jgi:prephenate dehydratase